MATRMMTTNPRISPAVTQDANGDLHGTSPSELRTTQEVHFKSCKELLEENQALRDRIAMLETENEALNHDLVQFQNYKKLIRDVKAIQARFPSHIGERGK